MSLLYSVIGFILAIGVLVAVHEFGHYWVARKLGVKVLTFSIGFGKPIWRWIGGPDNTEYMVARIPLGGYVKMLGEGTQEDPIDESEIHRSFDAQPVWKRTAIVAAGPGINFLFAIILFMGLGWLSVDRLVPKFGDVPEQTILGENGVLAGDVLTAIDGKSVEFMAEHDLYIFNQVLKRATLQVEIQSNGRPRTFDIDTSKIPIYRISPTSLMRQLGFTPVAPPSSTEISVVSEESPAFRAGLLVGDRVLAIDKQPVSRWSDLSRMVMPAAGQQLSFDIARGGSEFTVQITPAAFDLEGQTIGRIGVQGVFVPYPTESLVTVQRGPLEALTYGIQQTWLMSSLTVRMLWKMVTLQVSHQNVNGPIMIADVAGKAIQVGPESYLFFLAVVSISLGVMNLLPIPMLDGGHLMTYAIEVLAGKNIAQRAFMALQPLGLMMLAGLMSLAFYNDILRILN